MEEKYGAPFRGVQLNLFQWDLIAVGNGYRSLAGLDLNAAGEHFSRVLAACSAHPAASQGLREVRFWEEVFHELEQLNPEAAADCLWRRIEEFPFGDSEIRRSLRMALLGRLLVMLADRPDFYHPPDLCRGYLHLLFADYVAAERDLRQLLERFPENGRLAGYLGDALWMQGRRRSAGKAYARALLLAPHELALDHLRCRALAEVMEEHGPALAPVYAYFAGVLPLLSAESAGAGREAMICEHLRQAEEARSRGDHEGAVAARSRLKELAPEILRDYLAWLAR